MQTYTCILHTDIHIMSGPALWARSVSSMRASISSMRAPICSMRAFYILYACVYIFYACVYILYACVYILYVCLPLLHTWTGSMFYACLTYLKNNSSKTTCYSCF